MVRTYAWNPSTQSNPSLLGNFIQDCTPSKNHNLTEQSTKLLSNDNNNHNKEMINNMHEKLEQIPSEPLGYVTPVYNNHFAMDPKIACWAQQPQGTLIQPHYCHCQHIPASNLPQLLVRLNSPMYPWLLRPVKIGDKVYYEPLPTAVNQPSSTLFQTSAQTVIASTSGENVISTHVRTLL